MIYLLSLLGFLSLLSSHSARAASSCVAFDINWNLLAFGFNGKDYNAGTQDTWTSSNTAKDITTSGRPPFNGQNVVCFLSQFSNAIYVLGADNANPASIYIYDAAALSWSVQSTTPGSFDPTSFNAILDHDTNVFYAISKGELFSLDMAQLKAAQSNAIPWNDIQKPPFNVDQPVMALAQNHIHFLNVEGVPAGSAKIFVIHFSFFQPDPQSYGNFPATHGQATSFFKDSGVQQEFAFIPDDGSATYVINVETNTTQTLKGPTVKDPLANYFASVSSLVQLASSGSVSFLPYNADSTSANSAAAWTTINTLPNAGTTSSNNGQSSNSGSPTPSTSGAKNTNTNTKLPASSGTQTPGQSGGSVSSAAANLGVVAMILTFTVAALL